MPILNWLDKEKHINSDKLVSYRLLEQDSKFCFGEDTDNMIIQGDNLDALKSLLPYYAGKVKCIYIDPPYNTGDVQPDYDDNLEHSIWLGIMYPRLKLLRELLTEDGVIFVQIDDKEAPYLKTIMDEIFGRKNYETTFYIKVRHENRILRKDIRYQLVMEQVLSYRKSDLYSPPRRVKSKKTNNDYIYDIEIINNCDDIINLSGYDVEIYSPQNYKIVESDSGSLKKYQIRGSLITQSGSASEYYEKNLKQRRNLDGLGTLYKVIGMGVKGDGLGHRFIMQPKKENSKNGFYFQGKPISNKVITGIPYQNFYDYESAFNRVGYEGSVEFKNGKKPELYIKFFLDFGSSKGDLVLDSFLGSGTTCAVAHKMGRKYIGIEMGNHAKTHCVPRLEKVISGEAGGISKDINWTGGGGFKFYTLGDTVFDEYGKINPVIKFHTLASHIWFYETNNPKDNKYNDMLLGINDNTAYILLYNGILGDKKPQNGNVLTRKILSEIHSKINNHTKGFTGSIVVYGESCRLGENTLQDNNIMFKQTPYDLKI